MDASVSEGVRPERRSRKVRSEAEQARGRGRTEAAGNEAARLERGDRMATSGSRILELKGI